MARRIHLRADVSVDALERRYRAAKEPYESSSWQILWLLSRGLSARQGAAGTDYLAYWIGQLAKRYNTADPSGMRNGGRTDSYRPRLLNATPQEELRAALQGPTPERVDLRTNGGEVLFQGCGRPWVAPTNRTRLYGLTGGGGPEQDSHSPFPGREGGVRVRSGLYWLSSARRA
jgi:hypothetical protein